MKTVTVKLYHWDELNETAKRHYWEHGGLDFSGDYSSDYERTLDAFCDAFDCSCVGWDVTDWTYHFSTITAGRWDDCPDSPEHAARWIARTLWNEYRDKIYQGKYFSSMKWENGTCTIKGRRSKIMLESNCPLTGYFADNVIMAPLLDCLNGKREFTDTYALFDACFDAFFKAWRDDIEYCASFEYFDEQMAENFPDQYFTEKGAAWD